MVQAAQGWPQMVHWQSNLEPEQCRLGKHTRCERGKPSVAETLRALPTDANDICLQYKYHLPPHSMSEQVSLSK